MMRINPATTLLTGIKIALSPNQNARPNAEDISLIVIHGISLPPGEFNHDYITPFFHNQLPVDEHPYFQEIVHLQVSAHLLIQRNGAIIQYVPFSERAWHAGESMFDGRENCNDFAIGIELEGTDDIAYTDAQYQALATVTRLLQKQYSKITLDRIVGHSDIAPGRKTDPGPSFDWIGFKALLTKDV